MSQADTSLKPGFIALHSNRLEVLMDTVAAWLQRNPLPPLEPEVILVQSNGMAEWVKMSLARNAGVCAAASVQLPARFQWQMYRQILGRQQIPARSPLDRTALTWRLMRLLPDLRTQPDFAPIDRYLAGDDATRRLQLAQRLADLYDQYQVHRPDWLAAWSEGDNVLIDVAGQTRPLAPEQRWQGVLWQRLVAELDPRLQPLIRGRLHERALERLQSSAASSDPGLPRPELPKRIVLFGMTHVPLPTLELLASLSAQCQVLLAVPNPCRFHWADIIDGREWLRLARQRHPLRDGRALDQISMDTMHLHAHPLLAAWGRQARDFVRQLDVFDDFAQTQARFPLHRLDWFDDAPPDSDNLLAQVQAHIRDLIPLSEHPCRATAPDDRSIVFHVAHSPLRELEVLHDQLLAMLAERRLQCPLQPRDIVVMVPDIDTFAPAIRAVFGQYPRHDPRHIPFDIADLSARENNPLLAAIDWLLHLPQERCRLSDVAALLYVPAIAHRFGIPDDGVARLVNWMRGAGMRWGLDQAHRAMLALAACGEQNTMRFGMQRMLMGYAVGHTASHLDSPFADIDPYDEVGGLDAELAGSLAGLIECLLTWQQQCQEPHTAAEWAARLRALLDQLTLARDDHDRGLLASVAQAITLWVEICDEAEFGEAVPLAVMADAWWHTLDAPTLERRFRSGGVTFCTLMPMRAIPFEVVCLLGMNEGDYPRRPTLSDFDLMTVPGQRRPGDRARRDDDRQLMLEALLSARRTLYVSYCGYHVRDNSPRAPSILVAQLRDYLAAGWSAESVEALTIEHPLQPFSRRYFEAGDTPHFTFAREWRAAHDPSPVSAETVSFPLPPVTSSTLRLAQLNQFLRNPVKTFFGERLNVWFEVDDDTLPDLEPFMPDPLELWQLLDELSRSVLDEWAQLPPEQLAASDLDRALLRHLARLQRAGRLPIGGVGHYTQRQLQASVTPLLTRWRQVRLQHPYAAPSLELSFPGEPPSHLQGPQLQDQLNHRVTADPAGHDAKWLDVTVTRLLQRAPTGQQPQKVKAHHLLMPWLRNLLAAATGHPCNGILIGRDATLLCPSLETAEARATLDSLLFGWSRGLCEPLPIAVKTALAQVAGDHAASVYEGNQRIRGENTEPCLARCFPDFEALTADGRFAELANRYYAPLWHWVDQHVSVQIHQSDPVSWPEAP